MKLTQLLAVTFCLAAFTASAFTNKAINDNTNLKSAWLERVSQHKWFAGSNECDLSTQAAIEILKVNEQTYIFRQSKCQHYEAPFIYLLLGENKAFLQDTGATENAAQFPLYQTVNNIIQDYKKKNKITRYPLIVSHSHSHSDHYAADKQFKGQPDVTLIEPSSEAVNDFFKFNREVFKSHVQLGNRKLTVIHIPGHQTDSVAIYDPYTGWLLTGDSAYPGRLYIRDWAAFKTSIKRLKNFSQNNPVTALMGTHIEMSQTPGQDYEMGSQYQPNELALPLKVSLLTELDSNLEDLGDTPKLKVMDSVIIYPLSEPSWWQKILVWIAR
ncbi:MBL fold metallo-hydrolase [Thalassotalea sp. M1531]|uniref:MBL fold metallo-hydrolase n=1 Tax=Thalassotalea algicola TaxID=2716224 RepID=A0A7Y0LC26_9GAMM|nr:MBL fold metallo-hydrolase [Thalassotalea algicola]NMP31691.1 MBL fold metallo-hydrolase [Thalassotalea algicola]